jgi:hypothetical protein
MRKFDFNDDAPEMSGMGRFPNNGETSRADSVPTRSTDAAIKRAVELVKKIGTAKARELCDLLDSAAE